MKEISKRYNVSLDDILEIINVYTFELAGTGAGLREQDRISKEKMRKIMVDVLEKRETAPKEHRFEDGQVHSSESFC